MGATCFLTTMVGLWGSLAFLHYHMAAPPLSSIFTPFTQGGSWEPEDPLGIERRRLDSHEKRLLAFLVPHKLLGVRWEDVGGCQDVLDGVRRQIVYPLSYAALHPFRLGPLLAPPKGVLFYGPPGCGKTMLAKAIATEVQANFLNLDISLVRNMWQGETEKLARAVFTLAHKLEPCIIFLDEVDSFLSIREEHDHATHAALKAIFLQQWDGLMTDLEARVLVLAATNRMDAVDPAVLRRLPVKFKIPKPSAADRRQILLIHLRDTQLAQDVDVEELAELTEGMSGSDLQEVCRCASVRRLVDYMAESSAGPEQRPDKELRPLTMDDLMEALQTIQKTDRHSSLVRGIFN